jgi:hypothetical protein
MTKKDNTIWDSFKRKFSLKTKKNKAEDINEKLKDYTITDKEVTTIDYTRSQSLAPNKQDPKLDDLKRTQSLAPTKQNVDDFNRTQSVTVVNSIKPVNLQKSLEFNNECNMKFGEFDELFNMPEFNELGDF